MRGSGSKIMFPVLCLALAPGCSQSPGAWWGSLNRKAGELSSLEARHHSLEREHERLKQSYFRLEQEYLELKARSESRATASSQLHATGSIHGRIPSSISYSAPKGIRSADLLALAYQHFTERRFAEAAASFEEFFRRPESAAATDASAMYAAGVAWFELGNYLKARERFEEASAGASGEQREKIRKKVDLWLRAINRRLPAGGESPDPHAGHGSPGG